MPRTKIEHRNTLGISFEKGGADLSTQLYEQLCRQILSGQLKSGYPLPSTRSLAEALAVSRKTITTAYRQLSVEGFIESTPGSGTFVSLIEEKGQGKAAQTGTKSKKQRANQKVSAASGSARSKREKEADEVLSNCARQLLSFDHLHPEKSNLPISFASWRPYLDNELLTDFKRCLSRAVRNIPVGELAYSQDPAGYQPLREAIAGYLRVNRKVECQADDILLVTGLHSALSLVAQLHHSDGAEMIFEDPGYSKAKLVARALGYKILPVPVDEEGLATDKLPADRKFRLLYATPSHQFPSGAVMSLSRRLKLLDWARQSGSLILEDDYDSEFRYLGQTIPALQGLDNGERVIYTGSFHKVIYPAISVGYVVLPQRLRQLYRNAHWLLRDQIPGEYALALTDFITSGMMARHIHRMKSLYRNRKEVLVAEIAEKLKGRARILDSQSGLHIMIELSTSLTDEEILRRAAARGVEMVSGSQFYEKRPPKGRFIMGFAGLTPKEIKDGVKRLSDALSR